MAEKFSCIARSEAYLSFCRALNLGEQEAPDFSLFTNATWRDACGVAAAKHLKHESEFIRANLSSEGLGIAAVDMPVADELNLAQNSVGGVAGVVGLFASLGMPVIGNELPFTLHRASHSETTRLRELGLEMFTPDAKLGFHNDGLVQDGEVSLPHHIVVYNLLISYRQPGNFFWVPTRTWKDGPKLAPADPAVKARVRLTPRIFSLEDGRRNQAEIVDTALLFRSDAGETRYFLNGQVPADENAAEVTALFENMKISLARNDRVQLAQRERRAIFMKNTEGFHARDVFEDPIPDVDLSRVFLRMVDQNSEVCHY